MDELEKASLEDLLKSLESHVVDSVEIKGEPIRFHEDSKGSILHVKISAIKLDPEILEKYALDEILVPKDLAFNILDADLLSKIFDHFNEFIREISSNVERIASNLNIDLDVEKKKEVSVTMPLTFSLKEVRKLLHHIKGTITETLRIRKPVEKAEKLETVTPISWPETQVVPEPGEEWEIGEQKPEGLYWCERCGRNHKYTSKIGKAHRSDSYVKLEAES